MHGEIRAGAKGGFPLPGKGAVLKGILPAAGSGGGKEGETAVLCDAGAVFHGDPGERAALYHGGSGEKKACQGAFKRKEPVGAAAHKAVRPAESLCGAAWDPGREHLCDGEREAAGSKQHPARDESGMRAGAGGEGEGVPAPPAAPVCMYLLRQGERPDAPGGPFGALQREHHADLYAGKRGGAGKADRRAGAGERRAQKNRIMFVMR